MPAYVVGGRWQDQQRSPVEQRETDDARVGGTDERELAPILQVGTTNLEVGTCRFGRSREKW